MKTRKRNVNDHRKLENILIKLTVKLAANKVQRMKEKKIRSDNNNSQIDDGTSTESDVMALFVTIHGIRIKFSHNPSLIINPNNEVHSCDYFQLLDTG
uniref:Uncharacterized protein n=1 Tax=Onchocerca volvulus TaxID=6282 RepID=A0A8R1TR25_ONCVO